MSHVYDPLRSPLDLPVQVLKIQCVTQQPVFWMRQDGSTPSTTLAGSFGRAVWKLCASGHCETELAARCQNSPNCWVHWLYKPYSEVQRRDFARPVFLFSPTLEQTHEEVSGFTLEVILWGRHAVAAQANIIEVIQEMGRVGLRCEGQLIPFFITQTKIGEALTIAERLQSWQRMQRLMLEFVTPLLFTRRDGEAGYVRSTHQEGENLPLQELLANVAYEWVAWDIEDRGLDLDKTARHELACVARDAARLVATELTVERLHLLNVDLGTRQSRGNKHRYAVRGFMGLAEIGGEALQQAAPWLLALCLAGGGQKRALGFGAVRAWVGE